MNLNETAAPKSKPIAFLGRTDKVTARNLGFALTNSTGFQYQKKLALKVKLAL